MNDLEILAKPASAAPHFWLRIGRSKWPFDTYADAGEAVLAALEKYHGRFSDLPRFDILNNKGKVRGHVSTNGRVWLGDTCVWPHSAEGITLNITAPPPHLGT